MKTPEEYKKLSVREFTKAAGIYESGHAGVYELCKKDYPHILEEIRKEDFETLLDAGCGTAPMLSLLTEEFPDKHYTGLDLTPEMIKQAKAKHLKNTEFYVGDCEHLPFPDNQFDIVINSQSCHHYPNPQAFFDGVFRVLRPGGRLILRDMSVPKPLMWFVNGVEMPVINLFGHGDVRVYSIDEVRNFCRTAGLRPEKIRHQKGFRLHLLARKPK